MFVRVSAPALFPPVKRPEGLMLAPDGLEGGVDTLQYFNFAGEMRYLIYRSGSRTL